MEENNTGIPAVLWVPGGDREAAGTLARQLGTALLENADPGALFLRFDADGLTLSDGEREMRGDFRRLVPRLKRENLGGELLVRAAKLKAVEHPSVLDATAGMGEDSLLLAAAGCTVTLYERDPVIAALLADTLRRAREDDALRAVAARMTLYAEDSIAALTRLADAPESERPDVVLLDPMFPERQKSALVKKKFQLLHRLEAPCGEEASLLDAARAAAKYRVIVKRPAKGAYLADVKPSYSLAGKAVRYDCLLPTS